MGPTAAESPSALGRAQWVAEETFTWAGFDPTILRVAALFYENVLVLHGNEIRETGRFGNSFGTGPAPWISGRDAADLAIAALIDPQLFAENKVSYPPGSTLLSHVEVAEVISAETGRAVEFEPVSQQDWQARLEATAHRSTGIVNAANGTTHLSGRCDGRHSRGRGDRAESPAARGDHRPPARVLCRLRPRAPRRVQPGVAGAQPGPSQALGRRRLEPVAVGARGDAELAVEQAS